MANRRRRTQNEIFVDALLQAAGGEDIWVTNSKIRDRLNWDRGRYDRVKKELVDSGIVKVGQGQGGRVKLPKAVSDATKIFISYCHADKGMQEELLKHLMPLKRMYLIETWTDLEITPGDEWDKNISKNLECADIVILLVSVDFINSRYCYDIELQRAITRHEEKRARVIPVIVRPCMWEHAPFARFQALPSRGKAVSSWESQDEALTDVAEGIYRAVDEM